MYGPGASATGGDSVAIGDSAKATAGHATAVGTLTEADGVNSFVAGLQAKSGATAENSVAIGRGAQALGQKRASDQFTASTIAIGNNATATENGDIVIGRQATSTVSKYHGEDGSGAVVMGSEAHSYGSRGDVVLGSGAEANIIRKGTTNPADAAGYSQSIAIGSMAKVYGTQAMAIGGDAISIGHSSIAIGGNDIDKVQTDLQAAVPGLWAAGAQNKFERETAALYPGTTLGSAALSTSKYRSNTASIGAASIAMGAMTQSFGIGSTAIGVNSMSKGAASTSIGVIARSWGKNSLAIGSQAGAYGDKSTSLGDTNMVGFDMTDGTTSGAASSAIGTDNKVYGNNSYVIGGGNTIGSATITETTEANGDKIKKVTAGTVKGNTAGAFGYKNTITTDNAYVVGNNSTASADGAMVLGSSASVTGKNGVALGNNTKVANENAVAIGNGSETAAAVATPSATINGVAHNFAGVNPASTVSVGKAGAERTITNVAAGRISATSTDAINGSQLYAVTSEVDKGVAYAGDVKAAAAAANKFTRKLGEQTNIVGGVADASKLTDGNIGVVSNGTDTLNIKLAKDVKVDSVTAGNTVINNNGLTVGGNTYVTNNGINANNAPITNVASGGTTDSNAANIGDVKKAAAGAKATVTGDKQATVTNTTAADGHTDYVVSATKTTLAAEAGGKVSVTGGTEDANGVIAYTVGLDAATKTAINNIGGGTIAAGDNKTVTGDTVNTYLNNNYYDKPTMDTKLGDKANTNMDNITNAGKTVINDIAADAVKVVNGKNTTVTPGTEAGANGTVKTYAVNVSGDLTGITSISNQKTAPGGTTTGAKITLGDTTNTVNVGGAQINNVADGTAGTDAVNVNQLNDVKTLAGKHTTIKAKDANVTVTEGTNGDGGKEFTVGLGNVVTVGQTHPVTVNGDAGTVNGLTNTTWDIDNPQPVSGQAATEDQLKTVSDGVKTNKTNITKNANDITNINTTIGKGLNFKGDDAAVINKKLGEQLDIKGGADASKLSDGNIGVVSGNGALNIKLAKNVKVDSVTTGNTVINNNGLTVGGKTYVTNNGLNANNQTITNVASGGNTTTNAANIGDVQTAVNNAVTNVTNTLTAKGLDFEGNDGAANKVHRDLGTKLTVKGGLADVTTGVSGKNLGVKKNAAGDGLDLVMSEKPEFKEVTAGTGTNKVVINDNGVHVGGKTYINNSGLNANNQRITNVATGTAGTDAVNVDQLNAAIGGTAKATTVKAKDANVTVTKGTSAETGGREYTVGLGNVVTVGQTHPVTVNGDAGTVNGLTNTTWDIDNPQPVSGQAATEDQLKTVSDGVKTNKTNITKNTNDITNINTTIGKGLNFKGDDTTVINKKLGEQLDIKGGADASKLSDGNIGVVSGNGALNIKLAKDVKVDSVTTGNTVINNNGLTVDGKTYVTNNGINANNQKVTNVADGQVAAGSKDAVNGGQLHDAKNEVINKGLRFNADNNSEKTNKLGSKVTVNGDNNITTEITQTSDDTKIGVKLNKDIHVKTVTAADTVKAGGVTMGGQTVANAAGANETGNYVTGLDNKTWNIQNPNIVSGRGATEDQLKIVSDEVKKQGANATDYRLVQNASSADGSYTVDTNGDIDLTVEDKNHAGQKETVKLKDIASKSKLDDVIAKGLQFDANVGGTKTNKLGSKITVKGEGTAADTEYSGENLKTFITQDPAGNTTINVKMNKNLKVETIVATGENGKDGKIGINGKDGQTTNISVTRDGKPGVDGAPGTTTTRIVYEKPDGTKEEVATLNDGMKYGGDTGNVIKKKLNEQVNVVGGITDATKLTTDDNIGVVSDGSNNLKVRLAKALKGLESITAGDTFINNNGITISNGAAGNTVSLTKDGLDNGGNKITNVAAGDVSANSTDAVNGSQLHDVKTLAGQHTTVKAKDSNITVTEGTNGTGGKEYTVGLGDKVTLGTDPSKQVSIDGTTGIIKAGDKVTIDGTTGNIDAGKVKINGKDGTVNGLTNKTWDPNNITSGQAATEDQLKAVDQKITNTSEELTKKGMDFAGNDGEFHRDLGDKVTIKGEGTKAASEYSGENIKTFADANGNLTVKMDKNLKTETIVATGKNGKDGKIGINGKDGVTTNISVTRDGKPGVDGAPGTTTTRIVYEKPDGTKEEVATLNDGMKYGGDTGNVIKKKLNEQVNVVGGITDENKLTTENNLGVVSDGSNNLKVRMAKDLKGLNSVTTNTLTVGDVKIDNSGINAGNKKITNVAAGDISANSTDAVNGGQLWKTNQTINNIGGAVNELGDRMDRVGAGAAALAALHPLDFDPDDKWDVAAGYGNYKDAHAVSVGAFYRPNEDTMFSVGGSFGGGENMVNAGVSVKLGQSNHVSTSKVAMAKEIVDLRDENKDLKKRLDTMEQKMNSILGILDMGKKKDFPDVPENHWAYEYVSTLAGNGILEGYPDGMFSGERSMTRYEFAAMFYRALKNGAPVDDNMDRAMNEFEPELRQIRLDRIRVDRISGKDNDRNKVERVRVNSEDDKANNDYRDVYGSHISPEA
ncbi:S-layer homology domain-containing protein [Dialister invisus]|uniref:S-layer homology domain-containing protein n=1 Tax=Dialister invisus TaxID=218538 RepID=UPI003A95D142